KDIFYDMCLVEPEQAKSGIDLISERLKGLEDSIQEGDRILQRRLSILLASAYTLTDDYQKAGEIARKALTYAPDSFNEFDFKELGRFLADAEQYDEAIALYEKMADYYTKSWGSRFEPYYRLGLCYYNKGEKVKAKETWEKITEVPKWRTANPWYFQRQQDIFLKHQMVDEAKSIVEKWLKKYSEDKELSSTVFLQAGRVAEIKEEIMSALDYYLKTKHKVVSESRTSDWIDEYILRLFQSRADIPTQGVGMEAFVEKIDKTIKEIESSAGSEEIKQSQQTALFVLMARLYHFQG
ncbi:unnamed protein product, partial [marine sediment metagenome]